MIRWFFIWLLRIVAVAAVLFAIVYTGDWAIYRLRGSPQSKVTVNKFVSIPQKARKTEIDFLGTFDAPCAVALFDQGGEISCWQLRRNPDIGIEGQ